MKGYFRDRRRFADLFNGVCFKGKQVIQASELEEAEGHYTQAGASGGGQKKGMQRDRDIKMRLKSGETLKLLEQEEAYSHLDLETLETVSVLLDIPQIRENKEKYINDEEKETGNMCQAIRELMEDARNEGIERGKTEGLIQGFLSALQELGISYQDAMQKLKEKFRLADDPAEEKMALYWKKI